MKFLIYSLKVLIMLKKSFVLFVSYVLMFIAFLIFASCIGYYTLVFDWRIPWLKIIGNAALICISVSASIAIY